MIAQTTCTSNKPVINDAKQPSKKCIPSPECPLTESMFNFTRAQTIFKNYEGMKVYIIEQNGDNRYNVGYSYGRSVMLNDSDYALNLRTYLDKFIEKQSQYQLEDIVKRIANAMPCWLKEEFQGFADAISTNNDCIHFTYEDIVLLNTVVLWTKIPKKPPIAPPAVPTSIKPVEEKDLVNIDLSPVSDISEEISLYSYLAADYTESGDAIAVRMYKRSYESFFDNVAAVMIYKLDHSCFVNIGFEGLIASLTGMNEDGIVLNTIQDPDQTNIKVVGASPPTIPIRITLENVKSNEEAKDFLDHYNSSIEQVFTIADKSQNLFINTGTQNDQVRGIKEISNDKQSIIYNVLKENIQESLLKRIQSIINLDHKVNTERLLTGLTRGFIVTTTGTTETIKDVFRIVYIPNKKILYVLMPLEPELVDAYNNEQNTEEEESQNGLKVKAGEVKNNTNVLQGEAIGTSQSSINPSNTENSTEDSGVHFIKIDLNDYIKDQSSTKDENRSSFEHLYDFLEDN